MFTTSPGWFITFPAAQVDSCRSKSCATSSAKWFVVRSAQWFRPRCGRRLRQIKLILRCHQAWKWKITHLQVNFETSTSHCYVWLLILSWWIWFIFCLKVSVFSLDSGPACTSASDWKPAARDRRIFGSFCDACNCAVEERCRRHSLLGSFMRLLPMFFMGLENHQSLIDDYMDISNILSPSIIDDYMDIIWILYGYYMDIIWILYGYYMDMGYTIPFNTPVDWYLYGLYMVILSFVGDNPEKIPHLLVWKKHYRRTGKSFTNKRGSGMTEGSLNLAERNFPENLFPWFLFPTLWGSNSHIIIFFYYYYYYFYYCYHYFYYCYYYHSTHKTSSNPAPPSYHHNMSSVWLIILVIVPFGAVGDYHHPWTGVIPFFSATSIFRSDRSFWISVKS